MGSKVRTNVAFDTFTTAEGDSDDSGVASSSKSSVNSWDMDEEPLSVIDQAAQEIERNPETSQFLLGRVFGAPRTRILPCKSCCPIPFAMRKKKNGETTTNFLGWTPEDYENMTDTCPIHYVQRMMEKRAIALADKKEQLEKLKKLEKLAKAQAKAAAKAAALSKKAKIGMEEMEIEFESGGYDPVYDPEPGYILPPKRKPVRTKWLCPTCNGSAKFGSCGCYSCGEWYHLSCVKFKNAKAVPKEWICDWCKSAQ